MRLYTYPKISIATSISWIIFLFILIYAPPILPYINILLGCCVGAIMLTRFNSSYWEVIQKSGMEIWVKVMFIILTYVFVVSLPVSVLYYDIVDIPHYYHLFNRFAVLLFMEFTCTIYLLAQFKKKEYPFLYLIKLVIGAAMFQAFLACIAFVFPEVKALFLSFMTPMGGMSTGNEGLLVTRTFGFAGSMLDQFGLCTGLIAGISFFLGVNYKTRYIIYSLFIMISSLLNARSGLAIYVIAICATLFISIFVNHNIKTMVKSFIMIALIPTVFITAIEVISLYNEDTAVWISAGVDSVIEFMDTGSSEKDNMAIITSDNFWELPDNWRVVIGTGHSRYGAEGYKHTDCGIVNDVWFIGILGVSVLYGTIVFLWYEIYRKNTDLLMKFLAIFFSISFFVFDVKAVVIGYQPGGAIFFFVLFAARYYRLNELLKEA